jgi:hypothetical protein
VVFRSIDAVLGTVAATPDRYQQAEAHFAAGESSGFECAPAKGSTPCQ